MHGNANAPYMLPDGTPKLVPRAVEMDTRDAGPCDPEVLSVDEIAGDAHGTFRSVRLAFVNRGARPCVLGGYPSVSLLNSEGETLGNLTMEKITPAQAVAEFSRGEPAAAGEPSPKVMLLPHQVAAFDVAWTTGPSCSRVARIEVRAPGSERGFDIAQPMTICAGRIQVTQLRLDEGDV
jgi:Protein of unknown function (DUF4232)